MAELSYLWETSSGTGDSDTGGVEDDHWFQILRSLFTRTSNLGGVSPDFQNKLAVSGSSSPVAVNTGAALVYGVPYTNTASVNVTIPTPVVSTRIDRVVLRYSDAARTVRITRIAGTEGGAAPALTQSAGTTWDVPLAQVSINTVGAITLTDQREYVVGDVTQAAIHAASAKTTPVAADTFGLIDSADNNAIKKVTFANLATSLIDYAVPTFMVLTMRSNRSGTIDGPDTTTFLAQERSEGSLYFDASDFPAAATVKMRVVWFANSGVTTSIQLYNIGTGAAIAGTQFSQLMAGVTANTISSDIKSSLPSGLVEYGFRTKVGAGTETIDIYHIDFLVEW